MSEIAIPHTTAHLIEQFALLAAKVQADEAELAKYRTNKAKLAKYTKAYFKTEKGKKNNAAALKRWRAKKRLAKKNNDVLGYLKENQWMCPHCLELITERMEKTNE